MDFLKVSRHRIIFSSKNSSSHSSGPYFFTGLTMSHRPAERAMTLVFTRCLTAAFLTLSWFCHCLTGTKLSAHTRPFSARLNSTSWALPSFGIFVRNLRKLAPLRFNSLYMRSSSPLSSPTLGSSSLNVSSLNASSLNTSLLITAPSITSPSNPAACAPASASQSMSS